MGNKQPSGGGNGGQGTQARASNHSFKSPKFIAKFKGHRTRTASTTGQTPLVDTVIEERHEFDNGTADDTNGVTSPDGNPSVYIDALSHLNSPVNDEDVFRAPGDSDSDLLAQIDVHLTGNCSKKVVESVASQQGSRNDRKSGLHLNLSDKTSMASSRKASARTVSCSSSSSLPLSCSSVEGGVFSVLSRPSSASTRRTGSHIPAIHRSSSLSSSSGGCQVPSTPSPTFSATKHRKVVLSPITSPNKTPTNPVGTPVGLPGASRHASGSSINLDGNILRKVASLTFENAKQQASSSVAHSSSTGSGSFCNSYGLTKGTVPQKLDISQLERFEGEFKVYSFECAF